MVSISENEIEDLYKVKWMFEEQQRISHFGTWEWDLKKDKSHWSSESCLIYGIDPNHSELNLEEIAKYRHPDDVNNVEDALKAAIKDKKPYNIKFRIIRDDGSIRFIQNHAQVYCDEQGNVSRIFGTMQDVTAEEQIKVLSEELTNIAENTNDFLWSVDKEYRIIYCNSAVRNHLKECYGISINNGSHLSEITHDYLRFKEMIDLALKNGKISVDLRTNRGNRVIETIFNPIYINEKIIEITILGKDITERLNKEREIIKLNASLETKVAERTNLLNDSLHNLQGILLIISHDFKTLLRQIELYANLVTEHQNIDENTQKIRICTNEILSMINGLNEYETSMLSKINKENLNFKKLVLNVFNEIKRNSTYQLASIEFETGFPLFKADKALLKHVIMNIISNALKFTKHNSIPNIVVGCSEVKNEYIFYFKDNGIGFDTSNAEKVFDVFTKFHPENEFEGTGVGLAIIKNIIQRHGGRTWIESIQDVGTTLYFSLPK